jgi:hypothetical protein
VRRNRKTESVVITDAAESLEAQQRRREIRYLVMMSTRGLCLLLAIVLTLIKPPLLGLWLILCVVGMVLLPWLAVLIANDRPAKSRAERRLQAQRPYRASPVPPALPAPRDDRIIDAEP